MANDYVANSRQRILDAANSDNPIGELVEGAAGEGAESFRLAMREALRRRRQGNSAGSGGGGGGVGWNPRPPSGGGGSGDGGVPGGNPAPGNPPPGVPQTPGGIGGVAAGIRNRVGATPGNAGGGLADPGRYGPDQPAGGNQGVWDSAQDKALLWLINNPDRLANMGVGMLLRMPLVGSWLSKQLGVGERVEDWLNKSENWNKLKGFVYDTVWGDESFRPPGQRPVKLGSGRVPGMDLPAYVPGSTPQDQDGNFVPDYLQDENYGIASGENSGYQPVGSNFGYRGFRGGAGSAPGGGWQVVYDRSWFEDEDDPPRVKQSGS